MRIPGIATKKNIRGEITHIAIDAKRYKKVIAPVTEQLGLAQKSQLQQEIESGEWLTVEEARASSVKHRGLLRTITVYWPRYSRIHMKISTATLTDVPALCVLVNSAYRGDASRKGWTTEAELLDGIRIDEPTLQQYIEADNSTILMVTNDEQEIIACVLLQQGPQLLYLGMLSVSPLLQAKGIGKLLLGAAAEKARLLGCEKIVITVISIRKELLDWYERHGFYRTGEKQPFPQSERFGKPKTPLEFLVLEKIV